MKITLNLLANRINDANTFFLGRVRKQVNSAQTIRNWIIGYCILEYEQNGADRAAYGKQLFEKLAEDLKGYNMVGMSATNLRLFRQFYLLYPQIHQTLSDELKSADIKARP